MNIDANIVEIYYFVDDFVKEYSYRHTAKGVEKRARQGLFKLFGVLLAHTFVEKILAGNYSFFRQNRIFSSSLAEYRWQSCFPASRPKVQDVL